MEAKQSCNTNLPDELAAKIVAMMPFPFIFKARMLSKAWLLRFSPIVSLDDEEQKHHRATRSQARKYVVTSLQKQVGAVAFQKQVLERSINWPIFFSFKFGRSDCSGYELASRTWRSLPSLSFLPSESIRQHCDKITTAGALLFLYLSSSSEREKVYMANILTRSSKVLPPRPKLGSKTFFRHAHIVKNPSMQTYKVIVLFEEYIRRGFACECYLQTYDSKSNAWSSRKVGLTRCFGQKVVHLNGVLYWIDGWRNLSALDCEEGTLTVLPLSGPLNGRVSPVPQLVVCNSSLLMVAILIIDSGFTHQLMKIDLGSGRLWDIASRCPALESTCRTSNPPTPVCHGDCIYFIEPDGRAEIYNLPKDEWSCFNINPNFSYPWDWFCEPCVFQPGLNPFLPL